MKLLIIYGMFGVVCMGQEGGSVVRFGNGDRLSGEVRSLSREGLVWESPIFKEAAKFELEQVVDVTMRPSVASREGARGAHVATLEMTNGDVLRGQLVGLSGEEIRLDTWFAGEMVVRRVNVKAVSITEIPIYFYRGPNSIEEWTRAGGGDGWKWKHGVLSSTEVGGIGREMDFPKECVIAFDAAWRGNFLPKIIFYSNDVRTNSPTHGYEMVFQGNSVHVKKADSDDWLGHSNNSGELRENEKARIEIKVSTISGKILLYIDGKFVDLWEDTNLDAKKLGRGFHIVSQESAPLRISNLSVTSWDGFVGEVPNQQAGMGNGNFRGGWNHEEEEMATRPVTPGAEEGRMVLRNGDSIKGEVLGITGEQITVKTEMAEVTFPISRLKNLVLQPAAMEEPKRNKGDVRATMADGSRVVFRLDGVEEKVLVGYSQNFGEGRFAKDAFERIEFNIYRPELEEKRAVDDWEP